MSQEPTTVEPAMPGISQANYEEIPSIWDRIEVEWIPCIQDNDSLEGNESSIYYLAPDKVVFIMRTDTGIVAYDVRGARHRVDSE